MDPTDVPADLNARESERRAYAMMNLLQSKRTP
jgi:hypothetical protein